MTFPASGREVSPFHSVTTAVALARGEGGRTSSVVLGGTAAGCGLLHRGGEFVWLPGLLEDRRDAETPGLL
jgi:hypothetical protein